ncbi:MAG: hypothetical protein M3N18_12750 [Actinomycetota bacterium]|nr:hypothetical protein [Actinomycetota bacterium]
MYALRGVLTGQRKVGATKEGPLFGGDVGGVRLLGRHTLMLPSPSAEVSTL